MLWGQRIAVDSIEGIATIEIMNMVADGVDIEDAVAIIQDDIEKIFVDEGSVDRGLYIKPENALNDGKVLFGSKWTNGVVKYRFVTGDKAWETATKKMATDAMADWKTASGGKVKFEEIDPNWWAKACNFIGQYSWVDISLKKLEDGIAGRATVGASFTNIAQKSGYVYIHPDYRTDKEIYTHELGHTLGLKHEHQRPDRDKWVKVTGKGSDYDKLPEKLFTIAVKKVKILFITLYLPYIWYMDYAITVGDYDFKSVMGYDSSANVAKKDGTKFYLPGTISETDAKTIKSRY